MLERRCLKKAAGSFPGSFKTSGAGGTRESKCPVLRTELVKSENAHLFGSKWRVIAQ